MYLVEVVASVHEVERPRTLERQQQHATKGQVALLLLPRLLRLLLLPRLQRLLMRRWRHRRGGGGVGRRGAIELVSGDEALQRRAIDKLGAADKLSALSTARGPCMGVARRGK